MLFLLDSDPLSFCFHCFIFLVLLIGIPCYASLESVGSIGSCIYVLICPCFLFLLALDPSDIVVHFPLVFPADSDDLIPPMGFSMSIPFYLPLHHLGASLLGKCHMLENVQNICGGVDIGWNDSVLFAVHSSLYLLLSPLHISSIQSTPESLFVFLSFLSS